MSAHWAEFEARARAEAGELLQAIAAAEAVIVSTIERECEALRTDRMLAAEALHLRLCDAARLYLGASRAARASLSAIADVLPEARAAFEERRAAFANVLKVELAVLATERAAARRTWAGPTPVAAGARPQASPRQGARPAPRSAARPALRVVATAATTPARSPRNTPQHGRR